MPIYDYRCSQCGREVEVMHGIHEAGPPVCEVCGGAMRKALSPPAIHFKGSGWAKKDAAAAGRKPRSGSGPAGAPDATEAATGSRSDTSADGGDGRSAKGATATATADGKAD